MFKIIDYAGETVKDGFGSAAAAYNFLYITYSVDFIKEMCFRVIKKEEEWVACYECEERDNCPNTIRYDGCVLGVRTPIKEKEEEDVKSE